MSTYKIKKQYFDNVTPHQREAMLAAFEVDDNGDIRSTTFRLIIVLILKQSVCSQVRVVWILAHN